MASSQCSEDSLNDSWVEMQFQQKQQQQGLTVDVGPSLGRSLPLSLPPSTMEKLLLEAQREFSASSSRVESAASTAASSRCSPRSPQSPCGESSSALGLLSEVSSLKVVKEVPDPGTLPQEATDWIWEWSSRPEAQPPSAEWGSKLRHPRQHKLSVRKRRVLATDLFSLQNLPMLLLTHACTFVLGAATVFIFLKKYCKWSAVIPAVVN